MGTHDALAEARRLVNALARRGDEVGRIAHRLLELLPQIAGHGSTVTRPSKRGTAALQYLVEKTAAGETLAERRVSGKSQPFRCPKHLYDAVVEVIADAEEALAVDEIAAAAESRARSRPADFQLRVPLRLWMSTDPPMLIRDRARYRARNQPSFAKEAAAIWKKLKSRDRAADGTA
jgi:hypothetical protein